jgi:hypothetical protein
LAEGNVVEKRISKVFVMDYETEAVLAEFPSTDIVPLSSVEWAWSTPTTEGRCWRNTAIAQTCE